VALLVAASAATALDAPHQPSGVVDCLFCHISHTASGSVLTNVAGTNALFCQQCHQPASPVAGDTAFPAETWARGTSHAWGVSAENVPLGTTSPSNTGMLARMNGSTFVCSTCHDQHNSNKGFPFLRMSNAGGAMCRECHDPIDAAPGAHIGASGVTPPNLPLEGGTTVTCSTCHALHFATSGQSETGTADSGTTTTLTVAGTPWVVDDLIGDTILFTSGSNSGRWRVITANTADTIQWALAEELKDKDDVGQPIAGGDGYSIQAASQNVTADAGSATTEFKVVGAPGNTDDRIFFTSGDNVGRSRLIGTNTGTEITWTDPLLNAAGGDQAVASGDTASIRPAGAGDGRLLRQTTAGNALCNECHTVKMHNSANTSTTHGSWGDTFTCLTCHTPHGTGNLRLVRESITVAPADIADFEGSFSVSLDTLASGVADNGLADLTDQGFGVCERCHTKTSVFDNAGISNDGGSDGIHTAPVGLCTDCHPHSGGFKPSTSCLICHNSERPDTPANRRQVVDVGGDFGRTSHHVWDGVDMSNEIVTEADCEVCHEQTSHVPGSDPAVVLKDPDGGADFNYDGTGASIEGFCLNCHDDGPPPVTPAAPAITIITADDPDDGDTILSVGDRITIAFDVDTNEGSGGAAAGSHGGAAMDGFFGRSAGSFGDGTYDISWPDARTLQIDVTAVGTASIPLGPTENTLTLQPAANIQDSTSTSGASTSTAYVGGDWGASSSTWTGQVVDGRNHDGSWLSSTGALADVQTNDGVGVGGEAIVGEGDQINDQVYLSTYFESDYSGGDDPSSVNIHFVWEGTAGRSATMQFHLSLDRTTSPWSTPPGSTKASDYSSVWIDWAGDSPGEEVWDVKAEMAPATLTQTQINNCEFLVLNSGGGQERLVYPDHIYIEVGYGGDGAQDITLTIPASAAEDAGVLTGQGTVSIPSDPGSDTVVYLLSTDATEITVPATVTIVSPSTSATFDITVEDDAEADGDKTVTVTGAAAGYNSGLDTMSITDNDSAAPFSDGLTPTNIEADWSGSTHATELASSEACMGCHGGEDSTRSFPDDFKNAHGSAQAKLLSGVGDLVCTTTCHTTIKSHTKITTGSLRPDDWGNTYTCLTCHQPHGSTNFYLVNTTITVSGDPGPFNGSFSPVLDILDSGQADNGLANLTTPGTGVCEGCHTRTQAPDTTPIYDNGGGGHGGGKHATTSCVGCHPHTDGFKGGGSCVGCHNSERTDTPANRRQVVGGGGDFERPSHHVGTGAESVTDADCEVCHEQSSHNPDTDPAVVLKDPDSGGTFVYNGAGASIEGFCVNCHDGDGATVSVTLPATALNPFNNGQTPTDIEAAWSIAGSLHNAHADFNAEGCMRCHGGADSTRSPPYPQNAHGSANAMLLSTAGNALCTGCHAGILMHDSANTSTDYGAWGSTFTCVTCHDPHGSANDHQVKTTITVSSDVAELAVFEGSFPVDLQFPTSGVVDYGLAEATGGSNGNAGNGVCEGCHTQTNSGGSSIYDNGGAGDGSGANGRHATSNCLNCHLHTAGFSGTPKCTGCHNAVMTDTPNDRRQVVGGDFARPYPHVSSVTDADCEVCHEQTSHVPGSDPAVVLKDPDGGSDFTYDGTGASIEGFCVNCHDGDGGTPFSGPETPMNIELDWSRVNSTHRIQLSASEACMGCHGGADSTRVPAPDSPQNAHGTAEDKLLATAGDALCTTTCHTDILVHNSANTSTDYGAWGSTFTCLTCHQPHGSTNIHLVSTTITVSSDVAELAVFEGSFPVNLQDSTSGQVENGLADPTPEGSGVCEGCHTQTNASGTPIYRGTGGGDGGGAHPNTNCLGCHVHTNGFKGEGGSCLGCHNAEKTDTPANRRQVVGTGGDFERTSHHVWDGADMSNEIVTDANCEVCHEQSSHTPDSDPQVLLKDPDSGATYTYTGTGGSIEDFCVNCHDSDGATVSVTAPATPLDPFDNGQAPANIAATWTGSGHDVGLATEACLACHGGADSTRSGLSYDQNAHGSANANLFSSTVGGETVTYPTEEGLCYACHDADGPSSADVETAFAAAVHHRVDDAEQAAYGGRAAECSTCHGALLHDMPATPVRGASNAVSRAVINAPKGYTGSAVVTSITKEYELCLLCHSNYDPGTTNPGDGGRGETDIYSQFQGLLEIRLSTDGGNTYPIHVANVAPDATSYSWTVPNQDLGPCRIMVRNGSVASDTSDADFDIGSPSHITVTYPKGAETLIADTDPVITWSYTSVSGDVDIEYSTNSDSGPWTTITTVPVTDGSYTWTNASGITGTQVRIRIVGSVTGMSANDFEVAATNPVWVLTHPQGYETLTAGSSVDITWGGTDTLDIDILFSADGGSSWTEIDGNLDGTAPGSYAWEVPSVQSSECLIRIVRENTTDPYEESNAPFAIVFGAPLAITAPNTSTTLTKGSSYSITWNNTGGWTALTTGHPVMSAGNNPYCTSTVTNGGYVTMEPPWNQNPDEHNTIWCSDCHTSESDNAPHGSSSSPMLKASLVAVQDGTTGNWHTPLCVLCHKKSVYVTSDIGSAMDEHDKVGSHAEPTQGTNAGGCLTCHYGGGSMSGIHGGNEANGFMTGSSMKASGGAWSPGNCAAGAVGSCGGHGGKSYSPNTGP
jgi:predicted CXXCH cytochrome family protein